MSQYQVINMCAFRKLPPKEGTTGFVMLQNKEILSLMYFDENPDGSIWCSFEYNDEIYKTYFMDIGHFEANLRPMKMNVIFSKNQINKEKMYVIVETQKHKNELCFYTSITNGKHLYNTFDEYNGKQFLSKEDLDEECCLNEYKGDKVFITELA